MTALIRILAPTGTQPAPYTAQSLADAARFEPHDGVYTITNTYSGTKALKLDAHLDRLEDSAQRAGIQLHLDRTRLRLALRELILDSGYADSRFRITVSRETPDHMILTLEPYLPPSDALVAQGVTVVTVANSARHNAEAKTTDWMHDRSAIESFLPKGAYTALLCDAGGYILEGLSSNFHAILRGELRTAGSGVLHGIAQQIVFAVAPGLVPLRLDAVHLDEVGIIDEAFITSSSRGILPVVQIDNNTLGNGAPGKMTMRLRHAYVDWANAHLEEI